MTIDRLVKKAQQSICKYKVAAMGFDTRGRCVGMMSNKPRFSREGGSYHAEILLMRRYKNLKTILIIRTNNHGDLKPIHPCRVCSEVASVLGIKIRSIQ